PVVQTAASVDQLMDNFLLQLFQVDTKGSSTTARVRALIGYDFSHPMPSIDQIAERLNMAVPTLHRRLQKEESGYQKIKDDCRRQVAVDLLLNSTLPIRVVAERLGFSDNATFHRAFRKWMGMTPAQFRRSESGETV
ncbi:MAG: helix-turn-helix transcriptional regulator, partial [Pseudomonadales bacterium]